MATAIGIYVLIGLVCLGAASWWSGDDGYSLGPSWAVVLLWPVFLAAVALVVLGVLLVAAVKWFDR